jgi:hypothetical protein
MRRVASGCSTMFLVALFLVGLSIFGVAVFEARRAVQCATWPTTPGKIEHLELRRDEDENGVGYIVDVRYSYVVDGAAYKGERIAFGYHMGPVRSAHEAIHSKLRAARTVHVRYDPSNPSTSCLSTGMNRSVQGEMAFGISFLLFATLVCRFLLSSRSDRVLIDNLSVQPRKS